MNSVNLIGRLVRDPELRRGGKDGDVSICNFTLAVDRRGSDDADFIRVITFGKTAEFADDYFTKGLRVGVSGRIQTGSYTNKDGDTVYTTDIIGETLDFADAPRRDEDSTDKSRDRRKDVDRSKRR